MYPGTQSMTEACPDEAVHVFNFMTSNYDLKMDCVTRKGTLLLCGLGATQVALCPLRISVHTSMNIRK